MKKISYIKSGIAVLFLILLPVMFFTAGSLDALKKFYKEPISDIETQYSKSLKCRIQLIDINGAAVAGLHMQGFYSNLGINVSSDKYIMGSYMYTTTDYEYEQVAGLYEFCRENNITFLYVNAPNKYADDEVIMREFGLVSYSNHNADTLMERLRTAEIPCIDLRDNVAAENRNMQNLFYRTDHHWTVESGLWATRIIAGEMNHLGCDIDMSLYNDADFARTYYSECWLGEQGRKVGKSYVGLDDFTLIKPDYETAFTFLETDGEVEGTFDGFIDESIMNSEINVYENKSWHSVYELKACVNHNIESGKVLFLGDSFAFVTVPFMALGVQEIQPLIMRHYGSNFALREYISENQFDTVIVCYSQIMIGAHDNPASSNYNMYNFLQ